MRILLVEFGSAVSGAERSLLELLQGLREEHELILACPTGPLSRRAAEVGIRVMAIPSSQLTFRIHPRETARGVADMARAARRLRSIVRSVDPAVVHANSIRAGLLAIPAARGLSPVVVHCRDALPSGIVGAGVAAVLLAGADHVVAISRHVAGTVVRTRWGRRRLSVVDNAVDVDRFDPARHSGSACRAELGLAEDLVVSVIAQITPWKGQDLAIEVAAELRDRGRDVALLIVGEAKFVGAATRYDNRGFERRLHGLVDANGLGEHVRFLGEREDPERILAATDVLLVPSTAEPFGRTIIEAMAMGVPVAATGVGGPREILGDGVGGRVVDGRRPAAWADAVEELALWSPAQRHAARVAALARFTRARHAARILAVYHSVRPPCRPNSATTTPASHVASPAAPATSPPPPRPHGASRSRAARSAEAQPRSLLTIVRRHSASPREAQMDRVSIAWHGRMWGRLVSESLRYPTRPRDHRRRLVDGFVAAGRQELPVTRLEDLATGLLDTSGLHLEAIAQRPHNCTIFELVTLGVLARIVQPRRVLEIGTYDGRGTLAIALNAPDAEIFTLNLPPDYVDDAPDAEDPDVLLSVKVASGERFLHHEAASRISQLYGNSRSFDFTAYRPSQLIFVDGGHDSETAMHDSRSALEIVDRENGIVVWHDATSFGVRTVTSTLYREGLPLQLIRGTDIAVLRWRGGRPVT